jgi:hypothetical protein
MQSWYRRKKMEEERKKYEREAEEPLRGGWMCRGSK